MISTFVAFPFADFQKVDVALVPLQGKLQERAMEGIRSCVRSFAPFVAKVLNESEEAGTACDAALVGDGLLTDDELKCMVTNLKDIRAGYFLSGAGVINFSQGSDLQVQFVETLPVLLQLVEHCNILASKVKSVEDLRLASDAQDHFEALRAASGLGWSGVCSQSACLEVRDSVPGA